MIVLIDGDVPCYACGFSAQKTYYRVGSHGMIFETKKEALKWCKVMGISSGLIFSEVVAEPESHALQNAKKLIHKVCKATDADEYRVFLTGSSNYREELVDYYKGNRDSTHKPVHYQALREYLVNVHGATIVEGMEADDMLGIVQTQSAMKGVDTCIATIDKDLNCIAGWHYNWNKDSLYNLSEFEALKFFYTQCLTGDPVDNIKGLKGIGPKKAEKILANCHTEWELYTQVWEEYYIFMCKKHTNTLIAASEASAWLEENANLLWILRHPDENWRIPDAD